MENFFFVHKHSFQTSFPSIKITPELMATASKKFMASNAA